MPRCEECQGVAQIPEGQPTGTSGCRGYSLHQAPGATGVATPEQHRAWGTELMRVVVWGWGWGQWRLVDDLNWGAWTTQGCGATGV